VSIGDYVLSGDVAALAVLDSNPQNRMSALGQKRTSD
jgi:tRNA G37 N-methylase TrmD